MMREFRGINYEGLDSLGSQLILCDDDVIRGCKSTYDLSRGFFEDVLKLDVRYRTDFLDFDDPKYIHYGSDVGNDVRDDLEDVTNDGVT